MLAAFAVAGVVGASAVTSAGAAPPASPPVTGCSWATHVGNGGVNGYDADLNAAYWVTSFLATPGAGINVNGSFPQARYMSISAYNTSGPSIGVHFYDAQIQPATGVNPFQSGVNIGGAGTYQVQIEAQPAPANPAPNTLYVGQNNALVYVMYRVYDSDNSFDPTGGAGLPQVSNTFQGRVTVTRGGCVGSARTAPLARPGLPRIGAAGAPLAQAALHPGANSASAATPAPPAWTVANSTRLPNADAGYLEAEINRLSNQIVVIRATMPTFPDTNTGDPPWGPAQTRYWSICEDSLYYLAVAGCLADYAVVESGGIATFVISTAANQPTNANAANGINWLQWGNTFSELVVYRQLLADPSFGQSITAIPSGSSVSSAMGPFYPQIAYCSVPTFQSAGAAGCLPPPVGTG